MNRNHIREIQRSRRTDLHQAARWTLVMAIVPVAVAVIAARYAPASTGAYRFDLPWRCLIWSGIAAAAVLLRLWPRPGRWQLSLPDLTEVAALPTVLSSVLHDRTSHHAAFDAAAPGRRPIRWRDHLPTDVESSRPSRQYDLVKRAFDLIMVAAWSVVVLPLIPILALIIKLDSPGPVFYSQLRVGLHGHVFRIYKFRSMGTDAERDGAVWAQEADPRVTRVGRFMRRARIDELPQLWNVLRGDMAFVGPRPERPEFTSMLASQLPAYGSRHSVKPGLTGWAQIRYRYASSVQDSATKLEYDLYYIGHRSLGFDVKILILTISVMLHLRGC